MATVEANEQPDLLSDVAASGRVDIRMCMVGRMTESKDTWMTKRLRGQSFR